MSSRIFKTPDWRRIHKQLPIFRYENQSDSVFYAPGYSIRVNRDEADDLELALNESTFRIAETDAADNLLSHANIAQKRWNHLVNKPYRPVCLTLYLTNKCNLECHYCFSRPANASGNKRASFSEQDLLNHDSIGRALELVGNNCAAENLPLTVVFHGGGEPTLAWDLLQDVVEQARSVAARKAIVPFFYIATHGVIAARKAVWLAENMNIIGLSCDGHASIQQSQRPNFRGEGGNERIEATARTIREGKADLHVRLTITPESAGQQKRAVEYVIQSLNPDVIRLEPAYKLPKASAFEPADAPEFFQNFLEAVKLAESRGVTLSMTGVRHNEIHGPYCNVSRDSIQIMADGTSSNCFTSWQSDQHNLTSNPYQWEFDASRTQQLKNIAAEIPGKCTQCPNIYHCARDCPDQCVLDQNFQGVGFRCALQQLVTEHYLASTEQIV